MRSIAMMLVALVLGGGAAFGQKILLVGDGATIGDLPTAEQKAYNWALTNFGADAGYTSFGDIATNGLPAETGAIWFHFEEDATIPASAATAASTIETFLDNGGGILLSAFTTSYVLDLNVTAAGPSETIDNDPRGPDVAWGIRPLTGQEGHPVFAGIAPTTDWIDANWGGFRTIADTTVGREAIRWWNNGTYPGTIYGTWPFLDPNSTQFAAVGEISKGLGKVITVSAPGFNWVNADINGPGPQANLEQFTANCLTYLSPGPRILMLGGSANIAAMPDGERKAYSWANTEFGLLSAYASFADIAANGIPESVEAIWFHQEDSANLPMGLVDIAGNIEAFVQGGGGLLLTAFGPKYVTDINVTANGPSETIDNDPRGPDVAWGIRPLTGRESHPIFDGINPTTDWADANWGGFRTIADTTVGREAISWWNNGTYPGTIYATWPFLDPNSSQFAAVGEIPAGAGKVMTVGAPGYHWVNADINGPGPQANLEKFTENMLAYLRLEPQPSILVIGGSNTLNDLPAGEKNAYNFVLNTFPLEAAYASFDQVAANGIGDSVKVIWYHQEDSANLPAGLIGIADTMEGFIANGAGLLLSGFATKYVTDINATNAGPSETIDNDPRGPDAAWGIRPLTGKENHPVFMGIAATMDWADMNWGGFRTIADSVVAREAISWWNDGSFTGTSLATWPFLDPNSSQFTAVGELSLGKGGVLTVAAPGFSWVSALINGSTEQDNLEQFTENMLNYLKTVPDVQELSVQVQGGGDQILENEEDGAVIEVAVRNATFVAMLDQGQWTIDNLPSGVTGTVARVDNQTATITLAGMPADYDVDITDFTVTIPSTQFVDLRVNSLTSVGGVTFRATIESPINPGKIAVIGVPSDTAGLDIDERVAYRWAMMTFGTDSVRYFSFQDIVLDSAIFLNDFDVAWWHYDSFRDLPVAATNSNVSRIMRSFHAGGGSFFLSTFATQYTANLGLEPHTFAMEILDNPDPANSDPWGYNIAVTSHPAFNNLDKPEFFTLQTNGEPRENNFSWWVLNPTDPRYDSIPAENRFRGTVLASTEWDDNNEIVATVGEYETDGTTGSVLVVGAGAYDWDVSPATNALQGNVETFSFNILNYLLGISQTVNIDGAFQRLPITAYPNPTSGVVSLSYTLPVATAVSVEIYDVQGRKVKTLLNNTFQSTAQQRISWDASAFPAGMYFYRLVAGDYAGTGKIFLTK